jgi:hypothetical protein
VRGGSLLGGAGGPLENYVGPITKYVVSKAPCRVILTAPPADKRPGAEATEETVDGKKQEQAKARSGEK